VLNKRTLVLEGVTLGEVVKLVVEVLVDLSGGTVLHKETTEDSEAAHPQNLAVIKVTSTQEASNLTHRATLAHENSYLLHVISTPDFFFSLSWPSS
jgi:hypothetical protein